MIFFKKYYTNEYIVNYFWNFVQVFTKQGFLFYLFFISAKFLNKFDFGLLNYWMSILTFILIFCDFGISASVKKYTSELNVSKNNNDIKEILFPIFIYFIIISILVSISLLLLKSFLIIEISDYIFYLIPVLFFLPLTSILDGFFKGLKKFRFLGILYLVVSSISSIISFILIKTYFLKGVLISYNIFYLFFSVLLFIFVINKISISYNYTLLFQMIKYGFIIGLSLMSLLFFIKIDIIILGQYKYFKEIANYEIINKILQFILIPFGIFTTILSPNITKYYTLKKYLKIKNLLRNHVLFVLFIGILYSLILYFILPLIIKIFLNKYYNTQILEILNLFLLIIPFLAVRILVLGGYIIATGNAIYFFFGNTIFGIINILLDIILIRYFGFEGILISTVICLVLGIIFSSLLFLFILNKKINKK